MAEDAQPTAFLCPITQDTMSDPVMTEDGQTYEREAIAEWFASGHKTSPTTGLPLRNTALAPNFALKKAIEAHQQDRPRMEAAARQVRDLRACLAACERRLREASARAASSVPHAEYELLMKRCGRATDASLDVTTASSMPASSSSHSAAQDGVVTGHMDALKLQVERAERASAEASAEKEDLVKAIQQCEASAAASEARAAAEELRATVQRKQFPVLDKMLREKEGERDAIGEQVMVQAEPLGMDALAMLAAIRSKPTAAWSGQLRAAYAAAHRDCLLLSTEKTAAREAAWTAERAAAEARTLAGAAKAKMKCLQSRLRAVEGQVAEACREAGALGDLEADDLKATIAWAASASLEPTAHSFRELAVARKTCQASLRAFRAKEAAQLRGEGRTLVELRSAGFGAADLSETGCSVRELRAAGFTASQLREDHFLPRQLLDAGFALTELVEGRFSAGALTEAGIALEEFEKAGCLVSQLTAVGFSAGQLKSAGFTAAELKGGGVTAGALKDVGFGAQELKEGGYGAGELTDAGFALGELKDVGFGAGALKGAGLPAKELKAVGFALGELKEGGFLAMDLKEAGYTAVELKDGGFEASAMKNAGFTAQACRDAGYDASDLFPLCLVAQPQAWQLIVTMNGYATLTEISLGRYSCNLWGSWKGSEEVKRVAKALLW